MDGGERGPAWDFALAAPNSAPGVATMVGYRGLDVPDTVHLGLPSASLTFILSLDQGVEAAETLDRVAYARPNPILLSGLHLRASHVHQRPGQAGVQLAVHPLAARTLFGVPASELSVSDYDGAALLGRRAAQVQDRLTGAKGWDEAFALICRYLIEQHRDNEDAAPRHEVLHAWHLLRRTHGRFPVGELAREVGVSARHLGTLFRREVGLTPKSAALLMRFEHARALMTESVRRHGRVDLARVAAEAGYADQAHLSGEFVRFAGAPPRTWLAGEFRNIQDGAHISSAEWVA